MLHAKGHDVHTLGIRVVELDELRGFDVTTGQHRIGASHDGRFLKGPIVGLGFKGVRLHPFEGVEGHHERNVQLMLKPVPRQTAEPVVGVDRVGRARATKEGLERIGVLAHVLGEFLATERPRRTGRDVVDSKTRLDELDVAHERIVTPGVDVDLVAEAGERAGEFAHVDVHPPAVTRAGLGEGRGVVRKYGEASHARILLVDIWQLTGNIPVAVRTFRWCAAPAPRYDEGGTR